MADDGVQELRANALPEPRYDLFTALLAALAVVALFFPFSHALAANEMLADTDLTGNVYRSFELVAPVPDFCRKVCEKDEGCQAWTFSWPGKKGKRARCFLKRSVSARRKDTCCISGYRKQGITSSLRRLARRWMKGSEADTKALPDAPTNQESAPAAPDNDNAPSTQPAPAPANEQVTEGDPGLAEKRAFCQRYARLAQQANDQARRMGCGFSRGLWGASYNGYFNWCMKNAPKKSERNTKLRATQLQRCAERMAQGGQETFAPPADDYPPSADYWRLPPDDYRLAPPPAEYAPQRSLRNRARWLYSWLKRSGPGPRATPWRPSLSGKCPLVRACECPQGDTCRVYEPGEIAIYWPLGCSGPPAYLVCRVRRR